MEKCFSKKAFSVFCVVVIMSALVLTSIAPSYAASLMAPNRECCITFNPNGGSYEGSHRSTDKVMKLSDVYDDPGSPVRKGYSFEGWYTKKLFGKKVYNSHGSAMGCLSWSNARKELWDYDKAEGRYEMTLYAHWSRE